MESRPWREAEIAGAEAKADALEKIVHDLRTIEEVVKSDAGVKSVRATAHTLEVEADSYRQIAAKARQGSGEEWPLLTAVR